MKRKRSTSDGWCFRWHNVVLQEEVVGPPITNNSDNESVYTIQSAETAIVSDTTDTETCASDVREYSPVSLSEESESDRSFSSATSSVTGAAVIDVIVVGEDSFADDSRNSTATDSLEEDAEIPKADRWECARCGCKKNNPVFRYCQKCFQRRKEQEVPRPQRRKQKHYRTSFNQSSYTSSLDMPSTSSTVPSSSQETFVSCGSNSSHDSAVVLTPDSSKTNMCNGCGSEQINAAFYHITYAHMWGCYVCSKRAWKLHKRCPICNGQSKVLRLFK